MTDEARFVANISPALLSPMESLGDAVARINKSGLLIACIVEESRALVGIITDSDVRRAILAGARLDDKALNWAVRNPITAPASSTTQDLHSLARDMRKREIPLLDANGRLVDLFIVGNFDRRKKSSSDTRRTVALPNPVLIQAGGLGKRLRSVVSDRPKPLAVVAGKPIIEIIVDQLIQSSIRNIYISVNYLADQIEKHFENYPLKDAQIHFVRETKFLGTAGSIGLIADKINAPLLVCNGDILTTVAFDQILKHHNQKQAAITCVVRPYKLSVPFGVVELQDDRIVGIQEKPDFSYFVNAGIYVLSPEICQLVPTGQHLDMPELVTKSIELKKQVSAFPLHEYWLDIGSPEDYERANKEFQNLDETNI